MLVSESDNYSGNLLHTIFLVSASIAGQLRTSRITMMLVHKVLDGFQVAIGTTQREWGVTSLVDCTCTSVLGDVAIDVPYNAYF